MSNEIPLDWYQRVGEHGEPNCDCDLGEDQDCDIQPPYESVDAYIKRIRSRGIAAEAKTSDLWECLEAFAIAFREPDGGPYFRLRKYAESKGIYADDLGRDRILLRIAEAALKPTAPVNSEVAK